MRHFSRGPCRRLQSPIQAMVDERYYDSHDCRADEKLVIVIVAKDGP